MHLYVSGCSRSYRCLSQRTHTSNHGQHRGTVFGTGTKQPTLALWPQDGAFIPPHGDGSPCRGFSARIWRMTADDERGVGSSRPPGQAPMTTTPTPAPTPTPTTESATRSRSVDTHPLRSASSSEAVPRFASVKSASWRSALKNRDPRRSDPLKLTSFATTPLKSCERWRKDARSNS